jgi:hypothetical protein
MLKINFTLEYYSVLWPAEPVLSEEKEISDLILLRMTGLAFCPLPYYYNLIVLFNFLPPCGFS